MNTHMSSHQKNQFDFNNLFVFEMANNHQGSVAHGIAIIDTMADIAARHGVRGAVKLQFRDLDTFIHPAHRDRTDNKHIPRFLSTRLTEDDFRTLLEAIKRRGLVSIVTPFDELSVDRIERLGVDIIKIGSCSAEDWPLLQRVAETGHPVVCSVGGLTIREVDRVVSFFQHRGVDFALMHCVAMYPTPNNRLHLNQIELMRARYPKVTVGFSTHEDPANTNAIRLAYAKGARLFEKHVGMAAGEITLNAYSANPEQVDAWLGAYHEAVEACGFDGERVIEAHERSDLLSLKRGVYARKDIRAGTALRRGDVFFAMPIQDGQMPSGHWKEGMSAEREYRTNDPIAAASHPGESRKKDVIYSTIHAVKGMLNTARIPIGHEFLVELSHHYGIERFHEVGATIIECINREYAKKLIVQLAGQWNPVHYHQKKDETFQVLSGVLEAEIEGQQKILYPGDTLWVPRGVWHSFGTAEGVIFEEVSTTSHNDDSFYVDRAIARLSRDERKTRLRNWGRHQFDDAEPDPTIEAPGTIV